MSMKVCFSNGSSDVKSPIGSLWTMGDRFDMFEVV
jgi:hypothetical protein